MKILSIDSSSPSGSVAFLENNQILAQTALEKTSTYSNSLLTLMDEVLCKSRRSLQEVDGFSLTIGPGSFTGLRVGASLVKGFVLATKKPFAGVNTLQALAALVEPTEYQVCPLLDARKKEVYCAFFKYEGEQLKRQSSDSVLPPQTLIERVSEPTVFIGPGLEHYGEYLSQTLGPLFVKTTRVKNQSTAASAGLIASAQFGNEGSLDLDSLKINYLRRPEAETKLPERTTQKGDTMDIDPQLLAKVSDVNPEFKKLHEEHTSLKSKVEGLNKKKFLTPKQEIEKQTIKKTKLKNKDRMIQIINEYQASLS